MERLIQRTNFVPKRVQEATYWLDEQLCHCFQIPDPGTQLSWLAVHPTEEPTRLAEPCLLLIQVSTELPKKQFLVVY